MYQYPKQILTIQQQIQSYVDAAMDVSSQFSKKLKPIGL